MSEGQVSGSKLFKTEDYWSIWLGLLIIALSVGVFFAGGSIKPFAVTPGGWRSLEHLVADFGKNGLGYLVVFLGFGLVFTLSMAAMGRSLRQFLPGYAIIFVGSLATMIVASSALAQKADLGAPLLALVFGLIIGNFITLPDWFKTSLRTEYYIKTGIVLLGATLPLTLIVEAGPIAFLQATLVSVSTWLAIYLAATRIFKLDPRFGAVLGAGGAVCGVSGSIAIGGAVRAEKDHIAIGIGVVSVWAIVMIFSLSIATKWMVKPIEYKASPTTVTLAPAERGMAAPVATAPAPSATSKKQLPKRAWWHISPGEAGAWIGTSEYADAAGFAVVAEIAKDHGDAPIHSFTLMKVIGRDIWIGIWAFVLSIISVVFWERKRAKEGGGPAQRLSIKVVWDRFPKFVLGFFVASIVMTTVASAGPSDHVGRAKLKDTFKSKTQKVKYKADFASYPWAELPKELRERVRLDPDKTLLVSKGRLSLTDLDHLTRHAKTKDQATAFKQLHHKSDWFESELNEKAISPIKKLRDWAFVFCFLCIGLSTRFKDLFVFGMAPFWSFTIGVLINVPLGFFLTSYVFSSFWRAIG